MLISRKIIQAVIPVVEFESTKHYEQIFNETFNSYTVCIYYVYSVFRNNTDRLPGLVHYPQVTLKLYIDVSAFIFEIHT
jgi:hypothetical protein